MPQLPEFTPAEVKALQKLSPAMRSLFYYSIISLKNEIYRNRFQMELTGANDDEGVIKFYEALTDTITEVQGLLQFASQGEKLSLTEHF